MDRRDRLARTAFRAMGSDNEVVLGGAGNEAAAIARRVVDDVLRIERKYSRFRDDSVVGAINRAAGGAPVAIDAETAALMGYARTCFEQSGGRFDITSGVLRTVWDFSREPAQRPAPAALAAARALIGFAEIEWDEREMRLPRVGMQIDLGGIGKEYAADRAATIAQEAGARHGLVNLGGDVRVFGGRPDGGPWRVGIRHPRAHDHALAGVDLADGAVATSGDYERFVVIDGRRCSHIIDASSGEPLSAWQSVSVVAPLAVVAGSYATIAMLMERDAPAFLDDAAVQWLGVAEDGTLAGALAPR
jgi:FAD:protein FMN transferase